MQDVRLLREPFNPGALMGPSTDAHPFHMDHLESTAWFWKREKRAGGWQWIEPCAEDHAALARWSDQRT